MADKKTPTCGDWFKLVESLALKQHDEDGAQVKQGDYFRFLGFTPEGLCECYCPRVKGRFWLDLEYLFPVDDQKAISSLEPEVPDQFKSPLCKR